jgi:arylsulfatase A-like enzyme
VRRLGLERETIIVVTSDHGEAFAEHGYTGHGRGAHDEVMRIPIIVWGPGRVPAGRRIRTAASLVDIVPTILGLADIAVPPDLDGESQAVRILGGPEALERAVFSSLPPGRGRNAQTVARTATTKWIATASRPPSMVAFDLVADPRERTPLDTPALLEQGRGLIAGYKNLGRKATTPIEVSVPEDTKEQLRALGYLD